MWRTFLNIGSSIMWPDHTYVFDGRHVAQDNLDTIRAVADDDALLVAASIADQSSDPKELIYEGASIGIAQLREGEVERWTPSLAGASRRDPSVAIQVMTAKLQHMDTRISRQLGSNVSATDRYMLTALAQNYSDESYMKTTIDLYAQSGGDWQAIFGTDNGQRWHWRTQLRLMVLQLEAMLAEGLELPPGVDLEKMKEEAFKE
jgi:hypothetical protein